MKSVFREDSFSAIISRFVRYYWKYLYYPYCLIAIRVYKTRQQADNIIDKHFDFVFRRCGGLIIPSQIESEFKPLLELLAKRKIKSFLEMAFRGCIIQARSVDCEPFVRQQSGGFV